MKKILLGSVALIVMSAPVLAADMPVKVKPLPPAWSWTGCYVGLNVGYGAARFSKSDIRRHITATGVFVDNHPDFDFDDDGALGGVQGGCNWQNGQWVWGFETDLQITSIEARDTLSGLFGNVAAPNTFNFTEAQSALRWFGTARLRAGWTVTPTTLLYVTGGFAYGRVDSHLGITPPTTVPVQVPFVGSNVNFDDQYHYGWTVGVGAEAKIAQNFTAKLEYLYVNLGSADYAFNNILSPNGVRHNYTWDQEVDLHVIRLGLNYQFNWYETVVAKY
jgi:outer membrane immunogenic protein